MEWNSATKASSINSGFAMKDVLFDPVHKMQAGLPRSHAWVLLKTPQCHCHKSFHLLNIVDCLIVTLHQQANPPTPITVIGPVQHNREYPEYRLSTKKKNGDEYKVHQYGGSKKQ
uniref:Uncharacterized protein n=1 Tax=Leersia perrieri TaxID=77586 RepID=A0A0D9W2K9_9ORYZ